MYIILNWAIFKHVFVTADQLHLNCWYFSFDLEHHSHFGFKKVKNIFLFIIHHFHFCQRFLIYESSVLKAASERTKAHQCLRGHPAINTGDPSNKSIHSFWQICSPPLIQDQQKSCFSAAATFAFSVSPHWRKVSTRTLGHHYPSYHHYNHFDHNVHKFG